MIAVRVDVSIWVYLTSPSARTAPSKTTMRNFMVRPLVLVDEVQRAALRGFIGGILSDLPLSTGIG